MKIRKTYNLDKIVVDAIIEMANEQDRTESYIVNNLLKSVIFAQESQQQEGI